MQPATGGAIHVRLVKPLRKFLFGCMRYYHRCGNQRSHVPRHPCAGRRHWPRSGHGHRHLDCKRYTTWAERPWPWLATAVSCPTLASWPAPCRN